MYLLILDQKFNKILTNLFLDYKESMIEAALNIISEKELFIFTKQPPDKKEKDLEYLF
jgi:hypothetical protein